MKNRLAALDVMRGLTVAAMILVNNPGSYVYRYAQLKHSEWHGLTFTDLVFPLFMFMVGCSLAYGLDRMTRMPRVQAYIKIVKRVILLFFIGYIIHVYPGFDFAGSRIPGVLQRIALAYGVSALICLHFRSNTLPYVFFLLLVVYWLILVVFSEDPYSIGNNATRWIDIWVFGEKHIYNGFGVPFDPEGLLGTISSVASVLIGVITGLLCKKIEGSLERLMPLLFWGAILFLLGILCSILVPVNKPLWTPSYVLITSGLALFSLVFLVFIIDFKKVYWGSDFFSVFGINALFAYCLAELLNGTKFIVMLKGDAGEKMSLHDYLYDMFFLPFFGEYLGSLFYAVSFVFVIWLICLPLYRKRIYVKI